MSFNKAAVSMKINGAKNMDQKKKIVQEQLSEFAEYVNRSLSNQSATGNVEFSLRHEGAEWTANASGEVCSGTNADGDPFFRQADELFNGDHSWTSHSPLGLLEQVSKAVDSAKPIDDSE